MFDLIKTNWISILSALIALLSAIYAKRQASFAKKQYNLPLKIYKETYAEFEIQTDRGFIYINKKSPNIKFFLPILISNLSNNSTSLKNYELILHCNNNLEYMPEFSSNNITEYNELEFLSIGENINPHSSKMAWCVFSLPKENYDKIDINMYTLSVTDIHNYTVSTTFAFLREEVEGIEENI